MNSNAARSWLDIVLKRLPMIQPGTLVVSSEGIGVFMGNLAGSHSIFGVRRGNRIVLETYHTLGEDW